MRSIPVLAAAALVAGLLVASPLSAQDFLPDGSDEEPVASTDESTPDYLKALALQRKRRFRSAQKAFQKLIKKYPQSVHLEDARLRSDENHFAGVTRIHESGPPSRRIDVAVMGDGFTYVGASQKKQEEWAYECLKVLWSEASFEAYKDYFNYYFVRLVSEDEKVDPKITDEQKLKIDEKNKNRAKKKKYDYSTALDCKAAGPGGQVMADRTLVYKWLGVAEKEMQGVGDDGLVIAFAQWGRLGMGGGGIANVGRPDKSITVHEFGHAFVGLLDEYANNPNPPWRAIRAANATSDQEDIPWQHWLDAPKRYAGKKKVGVFEGGATFKKGVWRPAATCAMNAAGATGFCPVCREASVLAIYRYVSPIDTSSPAPELELKVLEGDPNVISVLPMMPRSHELAVEWFVELIESDAPGPGDGEEDGLTTGTFFGRRVRRFNRGSRHSEDRDAYEEEPIGDLSKLGKRVKTKRGDPIRHEFRVGELPPGRYKVSARVKDPTKWVLKDERHLLEERETWWVTVAPKP